VQIEEEGFKVYTILNYKDKETYEVLYKVLYPNSNDYICLGCSEIEAMTIAQLLNDNLERSRGLFE
jgi:hypothetical protein